MRPLGLDDVFAWSEIFDKLGVVDEIANIQEKSVGKKDAQTYAGVQVMALVFARVYKVKDLLIAWIADVTNQTVEEVSKSSVKQLKGYIQEFMKSEELTELFTSLVTTEQP